MPLVRNFVVQSPNVSYTDDSIVSNYTYETTRVDLSAEPARVVPVTKNYKFKTDRKVPKLGYALKHAFNVSKFFGSNSGPLPDAICRRASDFSFRFVFLAPQCYDHRFGR
jgi:hypothetical protein